MSERMDEANDCAIGTARALVDGMFEFFLWFWYWYWD